jgi:hypothetical protein
VDQTRSTRWWLRTDSRSTEVAGTAEAIYDLVADLPQMGRWSPECRTVEWTGGASAPRVGATFVGHNRGGPGGLMRWKRAGRVLVAERGREFSFVTEEGGRESTVWTYRFEPEAGHTTVTETYEVRWIPTWARVVDVPTNRARELGESMEHTLARLKGAVEANWTPSTAVAEDAGR